MYAYLSFNEGIGPDRSHGSIAGHILLVQGGVKDPNVGNFTVNGTYALNETSDIVEHVSVQFQSVQGMFGAQTIHGMMSLKGDFKSGHTSFTYTAKGGHPLLSGGGVVEEIQL